MVCMYAGIGYLGAEHTLNEQRWM